MLYNSIPTGWRTESIRFLHIYLKESGTTPSEWKKVFRETDRVAQALRERHIKSRNKRCLKRSTSFMVKVSGEKKYYFRKEFPAGAVDRAVEEIERNLRLLKQDRHETSGRGEPICMETAHTDDHKAICARHFRYGIRERLKSVFGYSPGKTAWFKSNGLIVRDVPTPLPLALVEEDDWIGPKASLLITEDLSRFDRLDEYIEQHFSQPDRKSQPYRKSAFAAALVRCLKNAYGKKVHFKELCAKEVLVEEMTGESWKFYFRNAVQAVLNRSVSLEDQISNLMQLNESLSAKVGRKDQLRFLVHFFKPLSREERKKGLRDVIAKFDYS